MPELIRTGNTRLLLCFVFYLGWWVVAFNPKCPIRGLRSGWLLVPALVFGVLALIDIAQGIVIDGAPVPGLAIVAGGMAGYLILLGITGGLLHRPVTTELLIIVMWATVSVLETNSLVALGSVSPTQGMVLTILCLVGTAVSIVCYQLFYKLEDMAAFVDGAIPLLVSGTMTGVIALCAGGSLGVPDFLTGGDFGIPAYASQHDADSDGMEDQADVLDSARAQVERISVPVELPAMWIPMSTHDASLAYSTDRDGVFRVRKATPGDVTTREARDVMVVQALRDISNESGIAFNDHDVRVLSAKDASAYLFGSFAGKRGYGMALVSFVTEGVYLAYLVNPGEANPSAKKDTEDVFNALCEAMLVADGEAPLVEERLDLASTVTEEAGDSSDVLVDSFVVVDEEDERVRDYLRLQGHVRNVSDHTYYYVRVRCDFLTAEGEIRDWAVAYAATSEGLGPQESGRFCVQVDDDPKIASYRTTVISVQERRHAR